MSKATLIILFLILFPSLAFFQEKKKGTDQTPVTDPSFVEEIVVTGELVSETATVSTITGKQIKQKGAKTVAQALEFIPGVNVRIGGKGEAYIRIRGFTQRNAALLIDGIPVYSPYDGQLDLSSLPVDTIERIEVSKGASSVMYGSNAMGGIINIITRKSDGNRKIRLKADYGSGKTGSVGASVQGRLKKMRYLVSGDYYNQEFYNLSDDYNTQKNQESGQRFNSDRRRVNGKLSLGWDVGQKNRLSFNVSHIDQMRGLPHHESDKKARFWRFDEWQQGIIDAIYDVNLSKGSLKSKVYYQYLNNVLDSFDDLTYTTQDSKYGYTDTMKNYALGADFFFRQNLSPKLLLKSGLRFRYDHNRRQRDIGDDWENYSMNTLSIPVEVEWRSGKIIDFTAGTSLDLLIFDKGLEQGNKTTLAFNPQAAIIIKASKYLDFKLSISAKTRFPTMKELFSSGTGNPDLKPMKAKIFEAGFKYTWKTGQIFSFTAFYNDLYDLISRRNKTTPYLNIEKALFAGFETGFELPINQKIIFDLFYTYLHAEDKSSEDQMSIEHRPKHKVDAALQLKLPADFFLSVNVSLVSSQYYYYDDEREELDPYNLLDLKLTKRIAEKVTLNLTVRNLFDANYYESAGFPREGRMVLGGVQVDL